MKKLTALICAALAIFMLMTACGEKQKTDVALSEIYEEIKSTVELPEMLELTTEDSLDRNYGISADMVDDFAGGIDKSGVGVDEIVLIRAADEDSAQEIESLLNARLESKRNQTRSYNPEQYQILEKCEVERTDLYVTLIISKNFAEITEIFKSHLE